MNCSIYCFVSMKLIKFNQVILFKLTVMTRFIFWYTVNRINVCKNWRLITVVTPLTKTPKLNISDNLFFVVNQEKECFNQKSTEVEFWILYPDCGIKVKESRLFKVRKALISTHQTSHGTRGQVLSAYSTLKKVIFTIVTKKRGWCQIETIFFYF